jgi:hypothetical protein
VNGSGSVPPPTNTSKWLTFLTSVATIAVAIASFVKLSDAVWNLILVLWFCGSFTALWFLLYQQERRHLAELQRRDQAFRSQLQLQEREYVRKARYGSATSLIHDAFHKLRDAAVVQMAYPNDSEAFFGLIRESITSLAGAFTLIAGAACRVCIKQIGNGERPADARQILVSDLARSSGNRRRPVIPSRPDYISDNTDFEELFDGSGTYFFSNDLRVLSQGGQYKNSHWTRDTVEARRFEYLATIVWPIHKTVSNASAAKDLNAITDYHDLLGFLCVDSLETDVFDQNQDVGFGAAYADALYIVLKGWFNAHTSAKGSGVAS